MYVGEWERGSDLHGWWKVPHVQVEMPDLDMRVVLLGSLSEGERDDALRHIRAGAVIAASAGLPRWYVTRDPKFIVVESSHYQRFVPNDASLYLDPRMLARERERYVALCLIYAQTYLFLRDSRWASVSNATLRKACYAVQEDFLRRQVWGHAWLEWVRQERWAYTVLNRERRPEPASRLYRVPQSLRSGSRRLWEYLSLGTVVLLAYVATRHYHQLAEDGIRIVDTMSGASSRGFANAVVEALALVKQHDPCRYRRIRHGISFVVNSEVPEGTALYLRPGRVCLVRFTAYAAMAEDQGRRVMVERLAASLVHEATHWKLGHVPYIGYRTARVEALCTVEALRFLRALPRVR